VKWHFPNILLARRELKDSAKLFDLNRDQSFLGGSSKTLSLLSTFRLRWTRQICLTTCIPERKLPCLGPTLVGYDQGEVVPPTQPHQEVPVAHDVKLPGQNHFKHGPHNVVS
jgi:hypothetical protein